MTFACRSAGVPLRRERGQVMVEFALVATIFLTLFLGIVDLGRAFYTYDLVGQAARIGTRYAIVNATAGPDCSNPAVGTAPCEAATTTYILSKVNGISSTQLKVAYTWEGASNTCVATAKPGCYVRIEIDYPFSFIALALKPQTLTSTSQMNISQ